MYPGCIKLSEASDVEIQLVFAHELSPINPVKLTCSNNNKMKAIKQTNKQSMKSNNNHIRVLEWSCFLVTNKIIYNQVQPI